MNPQTELSPALKWAMTIPVIWLSLLVAQSLGGNLLDIMVALTANLQNPFAIQWTNNSLITMVVGLFCYFVGLTLYEDSQRRKRLGAEHGSATWGIPKQVNAMFVQKKNKLLTQNVSLGLDPYKHRRSLNVLVIGGSGASKTRGYVLPNILEANTNFVITDPKAEVLLKTGGYLKSQGYDIRVLNLVNLSQSDGYNPFCYLRDEKDALQLVNNLIHATTPKGSRDSDPFWTKAETALLQAIILLLFEEAPPSEQNFSTVLRILEFAEVKEDDEEHVSPLDLLFDSIAKERPNSVALRQYRVFTLAAGKTAKSILVSAAVRLAPFNLPQIQAITDHDDMDLNTLGERKCALYAVIPDNSDTYNFLVSLLYSQAFQTLYYSADQVHHGPLPCHVHFVLDEFAAMPLPGFTRELATMRSRNISASTIIQNMAQIKELYKDSWETIPGNSDTLLYLGGNEASTHKYISESLGKSTIDTKTHGESKGKSGSWSTNFQISGRELLTPDEVRMLDNRYAILFIRGAKPVLDLKYDLMRHPAIAQTVDGGGKPYIHKETQIEERQEGTPLFQSI
ncbi:type IV secretory system conjugative DNA transfer family protein [Bengtsoniella intestinalis]|uniref:VirD4-like conjugal transfer protein, CD1115 family n=1 Tax=Bengtsoniella intestinalis TaxID=3073143 RepID=UPI00391F5699